MMQPMQIFNRYLELAGVRTDKLCPVMEQRTDIGEMDGRTPELQTV